MLTRRHFDNSARSTEGTITAGSLLSVDGVAHLLLAVMGDQLMLVSVGTHHVYLAQDEDGRIRLPLHSEIADLVHAGRVSPMTTAEGASGGADRMAAELGMLDAAGVRNGTKAIAIHLFRHWTPDLVARFGPHDDPATIRRWRTETRRRGALGPFPNGGRP